MDILQTLVKKGIVEKGGVAKIENEIESLGISLEEALIKRGVSLSAILEAKGEYFDIPTKNLEGVDITGKVLDYIPEDSAMHYRFVPIGITDGTLFVGMVDPDDMEAHDALNFISSKLGMPFKIFVITETDFAKVSTLYKGLSGEVSRSLSELETEIKLESEGKDGEELLSESAKPENGEHEKQLAEDAPVTKIVATLLRYATDGNASDIHIEPGRESVKVRFRVDGVMNTSLILPLKVHLAVIARIKILSNMRLDEKRKPQDGRFTAKIEGRRIDFVFPLFQHILARKWSCVFLTRKKGSRN